MNTLEYKICSVCNIRKPFSEYYSGGKAKDGYRASCRLCYSKQNAVGAKHRKALREAGTPKPTHHPPTDSTNALQRHLDDFRHILTHTAPIKKISAPETHKRGLQFYRQGATIDGTGMMEADLPDGRYTFNLGTYDVADIVEFLWNRSIVVVYEAPKEK